jgi:hypothetical protein
VRLPLSVPGDRAESARRIEGGVMSWKSEQYLRAFDKRECNRDDALTHYDTATNKETNLSAHTTPMLGRVVATSCKIIV